MDAQHAMIPQKQRFMVGLNVSEESGTDRIWVSYCLINSATFPPPAPTISSARSCVTTSSGRSLSARSTTRPMRQPPKLRYTNARHEAHIALQHTRAYNLALPGFALRYPAWWLLRLFHVAVPKYTSSALKGRGGYIHKWLCT